MTHHEHPNVQLVRDGFEAVDRGDITWLAEHLSEDVVWHVGGNSKWAGSYRGTAEVLAFFARQGEAMGSATRSQDPRHARQRRPRRRPRRRDSDRQDGSSAAWKYVNIFHVKDGKVSEVWGMAENDADVDPFLDALPG